jgi:regulator of RNase E activity RraA
MSLLRISDEEFIGKLKRLSTTLLWDRSYGNASIIQVALTNFSKAEKLAGPAFLVSTEGGIMPVLQALHLIPVNHVLVVNNTSGSTDALLGDIIVESARLQQLAGIIVFGNIRDVEVIEKMDFPVWAIGVSIQAAKLGLAVESLPDEIFIDKTLVKKGDWLMGDKNGLISIDKEKLRLVIKSAEVKNRKENACVQKILSGIPITEQMNLESFLSGSGELIVEF